MEDIKITVEQSWKKWEISITKEWSELNFKTSFGWGKLKDLEWTNIEGILVSILKTLCKT